MKTDHNKFFQMRDTDGSFASSIDELRSLERPIPSRAAFLRKLVRELAEKKNHPKPK